MTRSFQLILLLLICTGGFAQQLTLVKKGKSSYTIVTPRQPTVVEIQAARVLQDYLFRISGAELPIGYDSSAASELEILVGPVSRPETGGLSAGLGRDGLHIKTAGKKLVIAGGDGKGVLYGVYTFLDQYLGCRKYTSDMTYVPRKKTIALGPIDDRQLPAFSFREVYYNDVYDPEFMDWHKLHSFDGRGYDKSQWGSWVHTLGYLLSPKEYGKTHPEYFSYYDGRRHAGTIPTWDGGGAQPEAQLCLTNPDVLEIVCRNLKAAMDKKPDALYWSVSQNDNSNYCRCDKCAGLDKKYAAFAPEEKMYSTHGGQQYPALGMGSLLSFVNQVADRFPDKIISTLAYQYSRVPPKDIVPRKNVNIMLCSIESSRNDPMETGDPSFSEDLKGWGKITDNILVWDYTIQFNHLLAPFPNLRVLQPNIRFLRNNNVSALFEQGNIQRGGEMAPLRAYLMTRMLWNVDIDIEKEKQEFLKAYYGKAAPEINEYIELLHDNNRSGQGVKMSIFGTPVEDRESFLSAELIARYNRIFDRAEKKVKNDETLLVRVKSARLGVSYATLEIAREAGTGPRGAFIRNTNGGWSPDPQLVETLYDLYYHCVRTGVTRLAEWNTPPREYLEKYLQWLRETGSYR